MNSVRSNSLSLKYQKFTPSDRKEIWKRQFERDCGKDSIPLFIRYLGRS